ncbi:MULTISPECIES: hypothetical protein [unclassified Actinomyces]|nr:MULTISPECIES: hypothetical protein [unclassified Actinomyces]
MTVRIVGHGSQRAAELCGVLRDQRDHFGTSGVDAVGGKMMCPSTD